MSKRSKLGVSLCAAGFVVAAAASARAATIEWQGPTTDNNWNTTTNWVGGVLPTNIDTAQLNTGATIQIDQAGEVARFLKIGTLDSASGGLGGTIKILPGADITLDNSPATTGGELNIGAAAGVTASATMSGGNLVIGNGTNAGNTSNGDLTVADSAANINASFTQTGGTISIGDGYLLAAGAGATGSVATVTQSGGDTTVRRGVFIAGGAGTGTYTLSGGSLSITATGPNQAGLVVANSSDTTGTMIVSGGTLNVAGQASIGSSLAQDSTNNNATFRVQGSGATISIGSGLTPDRTAFSTLGGGTSTLGFDIDSSGISEINISQLADLSDAVIDLKSLNGFVPSGASYDLLTAASIAGFPSVSLTTDSAFSGYNLQVVSGGNGQILQAVVPEPGSLTLAGIFAGGLLTRRRRRN